MACPGDLVAERSRFPRLLETVNNLRAHSLGFHLEPVGWESVIPSFGRPQDLINKELEGADLVIVMFWNRIGSPSGRDPKTTGTLEEYQWACRLFEWNQRPVVWIYFRKPTEEAGEQLEAVLNFRRILESGKDIFFREYTHLEDWEEMLREHLVAWLDGLKRYEVDKNKEWMRPERALLHGDFIAEGIYEVGKQLEFALDLNADGGLETVRFRIDFHGYWLRVLSLSGEAWSLQFPEEWGCPFQGEDGEGLGTLPIAKTIHIAFADVNCDGCPELFVAAHDGLIGLRIAVWSFSAFELHEGLRGPKLIAKMEGQIQAHVLPKRIVLPYGTAGLCWEYRWNGKEFECKGDFEDVS